MQVPSPSRFFSINILFLYSKSDPYGSRNLQPLFLPFTSRLRKMRLLRSAPFAGLLGHVFLVALCKGQQSSNQNFVPEDLWKQVDADCSSQIQNLATCQPQSASRSVRNDVATSYAQCFRSVFNSYFECSQTTNAANSDPIPTEAVFPTNVTANATCDYPQPQKVSNPVSILYL